MVVIGVRMHVFNSIIYFHKKKHYLHFLFVVFYLQVHTSPDDSHVSLQSSTGFSDQGFFKHFYANDP